MPKQTMTVKVEITLDPDEYRMRTPDETVFEEMDNSRIHRRLTYAAAVGARDHLRKMDLGSAFDVVAGETY